MSGTVQIRNVIIGEGIPKIIVPIVGRTKSEILKAADALRNVRFDIAEWRADCFEYALDADKVEDTALSLRKRLGDVPLLFTFRTAKEGGETAIEPDAYRELNLRIAASRLADLIDVEAFSGEESVREIIAAAHQAEVKVIASNHDFAKTPDQEELVRRLRHMQALGADIPKLAVMPKTKRDVLTLLLATEEMTDRYADRPIITMSMAKNGLISRLAGEVFGSACTFGAVGQASAPGQMDAGDLDTVLKLIHRSMEGETV